MCFVFVFVFKLIRWCACENVFTTKDCSPHLRLVFTISIVEFACRYAHIPFYYVQKLCINLVSLLELHCCFLWQFIYLLQVEITSCLQVRCWRAIEGGGIETTIHGIRQNIFVCPYVMHESWHRLPSDLVCNLSLT